MDMSEEKKRVNAVIDLDLYVRITEAGYGISEAVTKGFEKLLEDPNATHEINASTNSQEIEEYQRDIAGYKENIKALNVEIARLKEVLQNAPDPVELAEARTRIEGLQMVLDERNKRITELTQYKEDIGAFANYFKSNTVKQIEAHAAEKVKPWWKFWE
jgi:hypothetical protein